MEVIIRKSVIALMNVRDWLLARLFFFFMWFVQLFPADAAINTIEKLGVFFGMHYPRTKIARQNLKQAFPEKSGEEIEIILREMWSNISRVAAEYFYLDEIFSIDEENQQNGRIEITGGENFDEMKALEGPAICFTAHTGNWEILPVASAFFGLNIIALFRPPNNKYIAKKVLAARRTNMGHLVPSKVGASWSLASVMENGGKVGVLVDQFFYKGVLLDFFGHETLANPLLGKLARQFDCPVYPARTIRLPNGRFRIDIQPKLEIPRNESGHVDVDELTRRVNQVVEGWVREYPGQWLWLHKRWRPNTLAKWRRKKAKRAQKMGKQPE